jgi:hypothetical protein
VVGLLGCESIRPSHKDEAACRDERGSDSCRCTDAGVAPVKAVVDLDDDRLRVWARGRSSSVGDGTECGEGYRDRDEVATGRRRD